MIVTFPPEIEKKITALAAQKSLDPASFVASLVAKELSDDDGPDALKKATEIITNRTPAEREAIRQELLKAIPEPSANSRRQDGF